MRMVAGTVAVGLAVLASSGSAEVTLEVDGKQYTLTALMENCQTVADDPAAQVACFNAVSQLLEQQSAEPETPVTTNVPAALDALRSVAQYEDAESGLVIQGADCNAQILYYANYFHISRRNVSSIDLFSAQLDMSQLALDEIVQTTGGSVSIARGAMQPDAVVVTFGGETIGSDAYGIAPKSARMSVAEYAVTVADQLATQESGEFDFVLVHPAKQQSSAEIWGAFNAYAQACQQ